MPRGNDESSRQKWERWRESIKTPFLLKALSEHASGERKMSSTQIRAAEILLKRTLPELRQIDVDGNLHLSGDVVIDLGGDRAEIQSQG